MVPALVAHVFDAELVLAESEDVDPVEASQNWIVAVFEADSHAEVGDGEVDFGSSLRANTDHYHSASVH